MPDFIVIEGNIGAGKTTLASMISDEFNAKLILEQFAENPFLPKFYKEPERYAFQLEMSFLIDRYNQMKKELCNYDLFKSFVISDYYFTKSLIFAKITLGEDEFKLYRKLFNIIYKTLPKPDIYVYLHTDTDKAIRNIRSRGRSYEQDIQPEYLVKIQNAYFEYFKQQQDFKFLVIDMNNLDFVNNNSDYQKIKNLIFNTDLREGISRASI